MEEGSNPSKGYRFNRKVGFFTYSRAENLTKEIIRDFYVDIDPNCDYLIAQEKHEDGGKHFHCMIKFSKKLDKKNSRWNDIMGYHCNDAGAVKSHEDVTKYCMKDGDYISQGIELREDRTKFWGEALKRAADGDREGAWKLLCDKSPKEVLLRGNQIKQNLCTLCPLQNNLVSEAIEYEKRFRVHNVMDQWFVNWVWTKTKDRKPCLFLIGGTFLGKTSYIRSQGKHLFYRNAFSLDHWNDDVDFIVFDDCDWDFVIPNSRKSILPGQGWCVATDKYMGKRAINACRPCVWIANEEPNWKSHGDEAYWKNPHNGIWVYISEPMWLEENMSPQI